MTEDEFHILLRLEPKWGVGVRYPSPWPWIGVHFCETGNIGWNTLIHPRYKCGFCDAVFPERVIGMLNMMNGLRETQ